MFLQEFGGKKCFKLNTSLKKKKKRVARTVSESQVQNKYFEKLSAYSGHGLMCCCAKWKNQSRKVLKPVC